MTALSLEVPLRRENVLHFLGYRGVGVPRRQVEQALGPTLEEARSLMAARGVFRIVEPNRASELGIAVPRETPLALGLVTIGPELELQVTRLLSRGETTRALLLDAAGSAGAEEAADELEHYLRDGNAAGGAGQSREAPRRFSPGYGRWPLTAQRALFEWLPHEEVQVRLLPSCLMAPRKSVSFALWLGPENEADIPEKCRTRRCADCDATTCPYREPS